jgi:hypothetical protein
MEPNDLSELEKSISYNQSLPLTNPREREDREDKWYVLVEMRVRYLTTACDLYIMSITGLST